MTRWIGIDSSGIERVGALQITRKPDKYYIEITSYKGMTKIITRYEVAKWTIKMV